MEAGFTPKDKMFGERAENFRIRFSKLLAEAIHLASRNASEDVLSSHQIVTPFTKEAERLTRFYTEVPIDSSITDQEMNISPAGRKYEAAEINNKLVNAISNLNRKAFQLTSELADFKERLLQNVLTCKMFTFNYPLLIAHIMREAKLFMGLLAALERRENIMSDEDLIKQEIFWNRIMAEHAKFIAGLLDPTEENLIETARGFGKEFDELTAKAMQANNRAMMAADVTMESLEETKKIRDFKASGTNGLIECKIKSIIVPLLGDHVLREANHYLCILGKCESNNMMPTFNSYNDFNNIF